MSGKLQELRNTASRQAATAAGQGLAMAARQELSPVMDRLDTMIESLETLPNQIGTATDRSAQALRESLAPLADQVRALKSTLETLPILLSQQADGIILQMQTEGTSLRGQVAALKIDLGLLPDALAREVAPVVAMAERLDEVLAFQQISLDELYKKALGQFGQAVLPTLRELRASADGLTRTSEEARASMEGVRRLSPEAEVSVKKSMDMISQASEQAVQDIRRARPLWWMPITQVAIGVLTAFLLLGGLAWLGMIDLNALQPRENAYRAAWEELRRTQPPRGAEIMDKLLHSAVSEKR